MLWCRKGHGVFDNQLSMTSLQCSRKMSRQFPPTVLGCPPPQLCARDGPNSPPLYAQKSCKLIGGRRRRSRRPVVVIVTLHNEMARGWRGGACYFYAPHPPPPSSSSGPPVPSSHPGRGGCDARERGRCPIGTAKRDRTIPRIWIPRYVGFDPPPPHPVTAV